MTRDVKVHLGVSVGQVAVDWAQFAVRCAHLEIRSWNGYQWHSPKAL